MVGADAPTYPKQKDTVFHYPADKVLLGRRYCLHIKSLIFPEGY